MRTQTELENAVLSSLPGRKRSYESIRHNIGAPHSEEKVLKAAIRFLIAQGKIKLVGGTYTTV